MEFDNKVILIAGASSGLGKGLALALGKQAVKLIVVARRIEILQEIKSEVESHGSQCLVLEADLADPGQAADLIDKSIEHYSRIDLAFLCVGGGRPVPLESATPELVQASMTANFGTMVNVFLPLVKQLRLQDSKSVVVQVNSLASMIEIPRGGHYSAAKVAAKRFIDSARIELRDTPVTLITLHPGFVQTENKKEKMMMGISLEKAIDLMLNAIRKEKHSYSFPWPLVALFSLIAALPRGLRSRVLAKLSDRESGKYTE